MPDENKKKKAQVETHNENQQHHQQQYTHQKKSKRWKWKKNMRLGGWYYTCIVLYNVCTFKMAREKRLQKTWHKPHWLNNRNDCDSTQAHSYTGTNTFPSVFFCCFFYVETWYKRAKMYMLKNGNSRRIKNERRAAIKRMWWKNREKKRITMSSRRRWRR